MTLRNFIRENRKSIDDCIKRVCENGTLNDEDRRQWVLNDEGLYNWARQSGVRV